jgi:hypothetical protein
MVDSLLASSTYRLRKKLYSAHAQHTRRKRSVGVTSVFWSAGQTLRISFLNGTCPWHKQAIVATACHWLRYANLHFKLVNDGDSQAEIRICTDVAEDINYSVLGNQSLNETDESMAIGAKLSDPRFEAIVLHEFGHALGMDHEHQHPQANIPWDLAALRPLLREILAKEVDDQEALEEAIEDELATQFLPVPDDGTRLLLPYDRQSIMHYQVRQTHTVGNWKTRQNQVISEKDKRFMRLVYPHPRQLRC